MEKKKGFTLIELIMVIAILTILLAVALPRFGELKEKSNRSADITNAKIISEATYALLSDGKLSIPTTDSPAIIKLDGLPGDINDDIKDMKTTTGKSIDETIVEYIQHIPKPTLGQMKGEKYIVEIYKNGSIAIKLKLDQVYPEPNPSTSSIYYR